MGHGGHVTPVLHMTGHGGIVSRRTANKKLTKLYWPSRKRTPKQLIVLLEPKKWRDTTNFFGALRRICAPPPTLKFVPAPLAVGTNFNGDRPSQVRTSKTAKIKKVILLYCCTLTHVDVLWYSNITFFIFAVFDVRTCEGLSPLTNV